MTINMREKIYNRKIYLFNYTINIVYWMINPWRCVYFKLQVNISHLINSVFIFHILKEPSSLCQFNMNFDGH